MAACWAGAFPDSSKAALAGWLTVFTGVSVVPGEVSTGSTVGGGMVIVALQTGQAVVRPISLASVWMCCPQVGQSNLKAFIIVVVNFILAPLLNPGKARITRAIDRELIAYRGETEITAV